MNYTSYTDDACTVVKKTQLLKLERCKHNQIPHCEGTNATITYFASTDATCSGAVNDTRTFVTGACTQTGPKTARTSKLVTCA